MNQKLYSSLSVSHNGVLMKLLVRNLARTVNEQALREMFEAYGTVQSCNLVVDKDSGMSKGFGFVEMPKPGEAKAAMKMTNGKLINGVKLRVKKAVPKTDDENMKTDTKEDSPEPEAENIKPYNVWTDG